MKSTALQWLAFAAILMVVLAEIIGPVLPIGSTRDVGALVDQEMRGLSGEQEQAARAKQGSLGSPSAPPGFSVRAMALIDGLVLWTVFLFASATLVRQSLHTRIRAIATPLICLGVLILSIILIVVSVAALMLMLSLLVAAPFGPIVYLVLFGSFRSGVLASTLGIVAFLRGGALLLLLAASWRYLKNKTLMLMMGTGYLCGIIAGFALGLTPGILHAIVDAVLAILFGVLAALWALILFLRSIPGITAVVRR